MKQEENPRNHQEIFPHDTFGFLRSKEISRILKAGREVDFAVKP
jgi:hypothetical protein